MSAPTPGPWRIESWAGHLHITADAQEGAVADVAQPLSGPSGTPALIGIREANARLIAAAPDMYEALLLIRLGGGELSREQVKAMGAAIAKAEGRS